MKECLYFSHFTLGNIRGYLVSPRLHPQEQRPISSRHQLVVAAAVKGLLDLQDERRTVPVHGWEIQHLGIPVLLQTPLVDAHADEAVAEHVDVHLHLCCFLEGLARREMHVLIHQPLAAGRRVHDRAAYCFASMSLVKSASCFRVSSASLFCCSSCSLIS